MTTIPSPGTDSRATRQRDVLSQPVRAALREALSQCVAAEDGDQAATDALRASARAARGEKIKPEHVVAMIRTFWYTAHPTLRPTIDNDPKHFHLIGTALDAYFVEGGDLGQGAEAPTPILA